MVKILPVHHQVRAEGNLMFTNESRQDDFVSMSFCARNPGLLNLRASPEN